MAVTVNVDGPALVRVDTGDLNALEDLGYTRDGAEIRFEAYFLDVAGDENGGESGPPIDVQYMGERAVIRLELTKFDGTVADKVTPRLYGGTAGTPGAAGTLMFGGGKCYRVLINTSNRPMNFPRCFIRDAIEVNKGTRFSRLLLAFEAYPDDTGVLYDNTTA